LKNNPQSYRVVPMGWMALGESVTNGTLWDTRRPPRCLSMHGGSVWWTTYFPWSRGIEIENIIQKLEFKENSVTGDSNKDSMEGSSKGGTLVFGGSSRGNRAETMLPRGGWGSHFLEATLIL